MTYINNEHINRDTPPGTFGGARCICQDCIEQRELKKINLEVSEHKCGHCGGLVKIFKEGLLPLDRDQLRSFLDVCGLNNTVELSNAICNRFGVTIENENQECSKCGQYVPCDKCLNELNKEDK